MTIAFFSKGFPYDMVVLEREVILGDFLEAENQGSGLGIGPGALIHKARASSFILGVLENTLELGVGR